MKGEGLHVEVFRRRVPGDHGGINRVGTRSVEEGGGRDLGGGTPLRGST